MKVYYCPDTQFVFLSTVLSNVVVTAVPIISHFLEYITDMYKSVNGSLLDESSSYCI